MANQDELLNQFRFLVRLRNSGITNMFGASPYLEDAFNISGGVAAGILTDWMGTFNLPGDEQPDDGR